MYFKCPDSNCVFQISYIASFHGTYWKSENYYVYYLTGYCDGGCKNIGSDHTCDYWASLEGECDKPGMKDHCKVRRILLSGDLKNKNYESQYFSMPINRYWWPLVSMVISGVLIGIDQHWQDISKKKHLWQLSIHYQWQQQCIGKSLMSHWKVQSGASPIILL